MLYDDSVVCIFIVYNIRHFGDVGIYVSIDMLCEITVKLSIDCILGDIAGRSGIILKMGY